MPAHWYYDVRRLREDYGEITGYVAPRDTHSTNNIMNMQWKSNKHRVQELIGEVIHFGFGPHVRGVRAVDIQRNWQEPNRHYHAGMAAGENTFNAHTARVLMRTLNTAPACAHSTCKSEGGIYNRTAFLENYVAFMSGVGNHNDSYAEAVHRQFAANYFLDKKCPDLETQVEECTGEENHDTPSIGGFVMLPPLILGAVALGEQEGLQHVERHLAVTHTSKRLTASAFLYARVLMRSLLGQDMAEAAAEAAQDLGVDLEAMLEEELSDMEVVHKEFGAACYIGDSLPVVLYLTYKCTPSSAACFSAAASAQWLTVIAADRRRGGGARLGRLP